jgi:cysteine desulfurase family protein (TIGR01976 family)
MDSDSMPLDASPALDLDFVRSHFPALQQDQVFFDNGGGSQILQPVLDRLQDFLVASNVQLGASYATSRLAGERVRAGQEAVATLVNAAHPDEVVMGPSTTVLLRTLAESIARTIKVGDEIIVTTGDHEANIAPWLRLEEVGASIRFWEVDPDTGELPIERLNALLSPRTRLVAMTHASNILGSINPVRAIADRVHARGAWLCVDGVGFAPHRAVDVQALGADFYVFSFYKVFGPHHAVLWGRRDDLRSLPGHGFFFVSEDDVPYKFQPGNVNYELTYSLLGLTDYLRTLGSGPGDGEIAHDRTRIERAFARIAAHEEALSRRLLRALAGWPEVRVIGSESADQNERVPIVSFTVEGRSSGDLVRAVDQHGVGVRYGHFYSRRLIDALGLPHDDGVVRVSMVHYNTLDEVDRLAEILERLL